MIGTIFRAVLGIYEVPTTDIPTARAPPLRVVHFIHPQPFDHNRSMKQSVIFQEPENVCGARIETLEIYRGFGIFYTLESEKGSSGLLRLQKLGVLEFSPARVKGNKVP